MPPSSPQRTRQSTRLRLKAARSKAARSRAAAGLPTSNSYTDPFYVLDDLCVRAIFQLLSPIDIVRCDAVSRLWKKTVEFNLTNSIIHHNFPYSWEIGRFANIECSQERVREFKRVAYEDRALRRGNAVWARHLPHADVNSIEGDYVVWHEQDQDYLQWQRLSGEGETGRQVGETKVLNLFELIEPASSIKVESLHVNEDGLLHAKLWVRDGAYYSKTAIGTYLARNVVFSLQTNRTMWGSARNYCTNRLNPIQIGSSLVYYVKSEARSNDTRTFDSTLVACEVQREKEVYMHHYPEAMLEASDFRLFTLNGHEYLILRDSRQLQGRDKDGAGELALIDGATGGVVQILKWEGSSFRMIAKPNSFTFALYYSAWGDTKYGFTRVYSRNPDGTFSCDYSVGVQNPAASDYVFNPFTLRGYMQFQERDFYTTILRNRPMPDLPEIFRANGKGFCLVIESSVSLPPKDGGVKRRTWRDNLSANTSFWGMVMMGAAGTRMSFFAGKTMLIFDFGAPW